MKRSCSVLIACCLAHAQVSAESHPGSGARNVILMIADGAGFSSWEATAMYLGTPDKQFQDGEDWIRLAVSTHALRDSREIPVGSEHGLTQVPSLVYDPRRAWDSTPVEGEAGGYPYYFEGYRWLRHAADSASTATALVSGAKTYVGAINVDGNGQPLRETLAELAHRYGKRVGTVSSVPMNHATPAAAGGAHNESRTNYCEIAWEMLTSPTLQVVAGAGNPDYDNNGQPIDDPARRVYRDVGSKEIWDRLTGRGEIEVGDSVCASETGAEADPAAVRRATAAELEALSRWVLKQDKEAIEALSGGSAPDRLLVVPQVGRLGYFGGTSADPEDPYAVKIGGTLQQQRGSRANPKYTAPGDDPPIPTVPTLESLTRVALNALDDDPDGFFLHVEGGAVDWAMHENQLGRMIEEMIDFERAVRAVVGWIAEHGGWENTLLVVTADHDHLLAGPQSHEIPFQPLVDNGQGRLPAYRWLSSGHSNQLVPLFARGVGAAGLRSRAVSEDPFRGPYLEQRDVYRVMREALEPQAAAD